MIHNNRSEYLREKIGTITTNAEHSSIIYEMVNRGYSYECIINSILINDSATNQAIEDAPSTIESTQNNNDDPILSSSDNLF